MMTEQRTPPRLYVASLTDYNAGTLHGVWVDATDDPDDIAEQIAAMLAASPEARAFPQGGPAEEYAIHDHDGWCGYRVGEYSNIERLHAVAELIEQHGEAVALWLGYDATRSDLDPDDIAERFTEGYAGTFDSEADYAESFYEDAGMVEELPEWVRSHVDWSSIAHDWDCGGEVWFVRGADGLHVFTDRNT